MERSRTLAVSARENRKVRMPEFGDGLPVFISSVLIRRGCLATEKKQRGVSKATVAYPPWISTRSSFLIALLWRDSLIISKVWNYFIK